LLVDDDADDAAIFCEAFARIAAGMKWIMYSTSSARKDIEIAYSLGAVLFITKPELPSVRANLN
jgi:hypothetical protein